MLNVDGLHPYQTIAFKAPLVSANLPLNASTPKLYASISLDPTKAPEKPNSKHGLRQTRPRCRLAMSYYDVDAILTDGEVRLKHIATNIQLR